MSDSTTITLRLDANLKDRLGKLASATQRSRSFLAAEAIREYVTLNEWQIHEIHQAVGEADAGDFAEDDEVTRIKRKWGVDGG